MARPASSWPARWPRSRATPWPATSSNIDPTKARIYLLEGAGRILLAFHEKLAARAQVDLEKMGVTVNLNCLVTNIDERGVTAGGEFLPARTVLWAAGVQASPLAKSLGVRARPGRTGADLARSDRPGHPEIMVIGDLAAGEGSDGKPLPGTAPGRHAGRGLGGH